MENPFVKLFAVNLKDHLEVKKSGNTELKYVSWPYAWAEVKKLYPSASYEVKKFNGLPYEEFKIFKRDVLEPVVKEINQVSNLNVSYVCIKSGRKCTAIKFDADFKDEQEFQKVIGIPVQKKVPVNRMDYSTFFPNLSIADANKIGRKVKKRVQLLYPSLPQNLEDTVVGHILSNLRKSLCESNDLTRIDIRQIMKKLGEDNFFKEITPLRYWQYMEKQSL